MICEIQRSPRWKSPERERAEREREIERMAIEEQQEQERRREASKIMNNPGVHPYIRDGQLIPRDRLVSVTHMYIFRRR